MAEIRQLNGLQMLPTEIFFGVAKYLDKRNLKKLSCVNRRVRDACLPFLFRKVSIEFSNAGFDLLESLLKSHLHRYIASFQYIVPELLKPGENL